MKFQDYTSALRSHLQSNTYFSPNHRLIYIATPKVACTSFKWWFSDLVGVRDAIARGIGSRESDPELVIHDMFASIAPEFTGANENGLIEALTSSEYFKFCLVRNPYVRAFSAWQSKWLLREPLQSNAYSAVIDDNKIESVDDIRLAFEAFLEVVATVGNSGQQDPHMASQAVLLEPQLIDYDVVSRIEDSGALVQALSKHLGQEFRNPFQFASANVSLLPYTAIWISDKAAQLIRQIYSRDFELFGYDTLVPTGAGQLSVDAMALAARSIKLLRGRNLRIGELIGCAKSATKMQVKDSLWVGDASGQHPLRLSEDLEVIATLVNESLAAHNKMTQQRDEQLRRMRDELIRAEAQLDLLKDVMLGSQEEDQF